MRKRQNFSYHFYEKQKIINEIKIKINKRVKINKPFQDRLQKYGLSLEFQTELKKYHTYLK